MSAAPQPSDRPDLQQPSARLASLVAGQPFVLSTGNQQPLNISVAASTTILTHHTATQPATSLAEAFTAQPLRTS